MDYFVTCVVTFNAVIIVIASPTARSNPLEAVSNRRLKFYWNASCAVHTGRHAKKRATGNVVTTGYLWVAVDAIRNMSSTFGKYLPSHASSYAL
ncbi:hypothetical protein [Polaromonas sp.]|uniref:hypothetical protein n=1 Tax=Polaromonas sp. TaxID=1869339 RepID=UPI0037511A37